jgi:hypothetical protein
MLWYNLGIITVLGVANVGKNMDNEPRITMLFGKGKKDLIVQCLVWYYVNLGYMKFVEQCVTLELHNELKVEFVTVKVNVLYHYPYLFRLQQVSGWLQSHVSTCWTCKCLPKLLIFINMLACQATPKDNDRKGGKIFSTSTTVESGQVSNDFWNTSTKAATKHPFIQT